MKVAIMQPYFFPYLGYFQLINAVDRFILLDDVQYINRGWINRNRLLKPDVSGTIYIIIPLIKHNQQTPIKDIRIIDDNSWKEKILRQIYHYKKKAPYYSEVYNFLTRCFLLNEESISKLNARYLKEVCDYIGINFKIEIESEMNFDYSTVNNRDDRFITMCKQLEATEYINLIGGMELYNKINFEKFNIKLNFLQPHIQMYNQYRNEFEPSLSIIDVMMFNSPSDIRNMVNDYQLL